MIVGLLAPVIRARAETGAGPPAAEPLSVSPGPYFISGVLAALSLAILWRSDVIRPGSFARRAPRRIEGMPWFIWLAAGAVVFLAAQIGAGLAMAALAGGGAGDAGALRRSAITHAGSYLAALSAAAFMLHALRDAAQGLAFRARGAWTGLIAFILTFPVVHAVTGVSVLIAAWIRGAPPPTVAHESLRQIIENRDNVWAWVIAAGAVLGAPIVEELLYRVFLQSALLRLWRRAWPAVITTAVLFTAVHIGVAEAHALPVLLVLGLALGIAYERTRNPVVPIVMHAAFNLLNVILALWLR